MSEPLSDDEIAARVKRAELRSQQADGGAPKIGRPTLYTDELVDEICIRISSGRSVLSVCEDADMPTQSTFYLWRELYPAFSEKVTRAREDRQEAYSSRLIGLADTVMDDASMDPQRINAAANAIDKAARLQAPKQRVEVSGPNGTPIQTSAVRSRDLAKAVALLMARGMKAAE